MATISNTYWTLNGLSGSQADGIYEQTEKAIIVFDTVVDNVKEAIESSGFIVGDFHRNDRSLTLQNGIDAEPIGDGSGLEWEFTVNYSTTGFSLGSTSTDDDVFYVPKVKFGKWTYQVVVSKDKESGAAIANPVGDPYDPLPIDTISALLVSVTVKENSPQLGRVQDIGAINNSAFRLVGISIPKYCAMFDDFDTEPFYEDEDIVSFLNTYTFKLKYFKNNAGEQIGFKLENVAAGFNQTSATAPNGKSEIRVADDEFPTDRTKDQPVATPQLLDANGAVTDTPYYQEWVVHDLANFAAFGLPNNYPVS